MKILIACEFSGIVRNAFDTRGHDVWSCDLLPSEREGQHIQDDVLRHLNEGWDLMIAHPPCTYLCSMGIWWNKKRPERWEETGRAFDFVKALYAAPIARIAIENPKGYLNSHWRRPDCIIQPWQFGHEASKATHLWLKNLPPLLGFNNAGEGEFYIKANGSRLAKWSHVTSGTNKEKRAKIASRTFAGIAEAMAQQWGEAI